MDFEEIRSGLELKFGPNDGIYSFTLFTWDEHAYAVPRGIYLAIPEFAEAEKRGGQRKWVTLGVDRRNQGEGSSRYCLSSQHFLEAEERPDLLLFHYQHARPLLSRRGEQFSASPREVYETHQRWAAPRRFQE